MHDLLLLGLIIVAVMTFTVWFGSWMHKNKGEALELQNRDEHESFLSL